MRSYQKKLKKIMDMHFPGTFYAKKIKSQKILKNAKTAFIFCFPCFERLTF